MSHPDHQPDLCKLRECAILGMQASVAGEEYASWAYHRWARRHVEELLYEDMWQAREQCAASLDDEWAIHYQVVATEDCICNRGSPGR